MQILTSNNKKKEKPVFKPPCGQRHTQYFFLFKNYIELPREKKNFCAAAVVNLGLHRNPFDFGNFFFKQDENLVDLSVAYNE